MYVPLRLPRSRSTMPELVRRISAWRRETWGSAMTRPALGSLPMTTGSSPITTGATLPGPASTCTHAVPSGVRDASSSAKVSPRSPITLIH